MDAASVIRECHSKQLSVVANEIVYVAASLQLMIRVKISFICTVSIIFNGMDASKRLGIFDRYIR
jgi:hypothetical protein